MGFDSSRQEIIITPEAKGMRLRPSSRGIPVHVGRLQSGPSPSALQRGRNLPGHVESGADYRSQKTLAAFSSEAARSLQLLQADPQTADVGTMKGPLHFPRDFAGPDEARAAAFDCQLAAGPDALLVLTQAALTVFERSGRRRLRCDLSAMFQPLIGDLSIYHPQAVYDPYRRRWAIAACAGSFAGLCPSQSRLLVAYSQTEDPAGDWWAWALDAGLDGSIETGHWADSPSLAVDNHGLYLTMNMFGRQNQFLYAKLRVLNGKEVESGGVLHGWDFWELRNADGTPAFSVQPAVNLRAAGAQYLLNAANDGQGLTLWSFMQPPRQNPVLSRRFIPTVPFQLAPNARQPLTRVTLETGDTRLGNVIFRHGMLWTAHTIAANWADDENAAAIQWFQINPRAGCVIHQGIYGAPHFHYFSPAVMADGEGNLALVFNRCGETEFPSIRFTGRRPSDEANSLNSSLLLQRGGATETAGCAPSCSAGCAPEDPSIWIAGQYAPTERDWAAWIGEIHFSEAEDARDHFYEPDAVAA